MAKKTPPPEFVSDPSAGKRIARLVRGVALASITAIALALLFSVSPVSACVLPPSTLEEKAEAATYIFVGRVRRMPADGAHVVDVRRVFRGIVASRLTFGAPGAFATSCAERLEVGGLYVFGMRALDEALSAGDVWFALTNNRVEERSVKAPTENVSELYSLLAAFSDTAATNPEPAAPPWPMFAGIALLVIAASSIVIIGRRDPAGE